MLPKTDPEEAGLEKPWRAAAWGERSVQQKKGWSNKLTRPARKT